MGLTPLLSIEIRMLTLSEGLLIIVISLGCPLHISVLSNDPHSHPLAKHTMSLNEGKKNESQKPRCRLFRRAIFDSELHTTHRYLVLSITALARPNGAPLSSINTPLDRC